jgi:hypothetical protein
MVGEMVEKLDMRPEKRKLDIPTATYWHGQRINEMTREDLIAALEWAGREINRLNEERWGK